MCCLFYWKTSSFVGRFGSFKLFGQDFLLRNVVNATARTNKNPYAQEAPGKVRKRSQTKNHSEISIKSPCLWGATSRSKCARICSILDVCENDNISTTWNVFSLEWNDQTLMSYISRWNAIIWTQVHIPVGLWENPPKATNTYIPSSWFYEVEHALKLTSPSS